MNLTTRERAAYWFAQSGLTLADLAERLDWDICKVWRVVSQRQDPKGADIEALADALGLSPAEFYGCSIDGGE